MFKTTAERTEIRNQLGELLKSCSIGDTVPNASILKVTGLTMDQTRPMLYSVMNALNKSSGIVFSSVFGVGYQRVPISGLHHVGASTRRSITRKSRRAQKTIVNALGRANDVDPATRKRLHSEVGVLGLVELAASEKSFKKVSATLDDDAVTQRVPTATEISQSMVAALGLK